MPHAKCVAPNTKGEDLTPSLHWMESFWAHFKGENVSLFLDAATLEELEWVIGRQMDYYNCERRHSSLDYRSPMEYLVNIGFIPETVAENGGGKSGSATGAQGRRARTAVVNSGCRRKMMTSEM